MLRSSLSKQVCRQAQCTTDGLPQTVSSVVSGTAENVRQKLPLGAAGKVVAGVQSLSIGLEYRSLSFSEIEGSIRFSAYTPTHARLGPMAFFGRTRRAKSILTRPQAARAWLHVKRVSRKHAPVLPCD